VDSNGTLPIDHSYFKRARECSCESVDRDGERAGNEKMDKGLSKTEGKRSHHIGVTRVNKRVHSKRSNQKELHRATTGRAKKLRG
jgi:hypothetical protein